MKDIDDRRCFFLPYSLPEFRLHLSNFPFNFVQRRDAVQRSLDEPAPVGHAHSAMTWALKDFE
jgi:hypothetical protein